MYEETRLCQMVPSAKIGTKLLDYYHFATDLIFKLESQMSQAGDLS